MIVRLLAWTEVDHAALADEGYIHAVPLNIKDMSAYPEDADELAEMASRLCYLSWHRPNPKTATNESYLRHIIDVGHFSVLEHASFTFAISGVSRSFTHELVRHRHLSFSQVSQRYVDESQAEFVSPPGSNPVEAGVFDNVRKVALESYEAILALRQASGASRKEARQAARAVLPNATETRIVVSGNVRAWRDVLAKRLSPQADKEFQIIARKILSHIHRKAPNSIQDLWEQYMGATT